MSKDIPDSDGSLDVAIVGMGPRGLSVLEGLLMRAPESEAERIRIWVFDPGEPGAGRIWRTTQPEWFLMNTPAGEVSMFSGSPDHGPTRAGAGPSLAEWLRTHPDPRWSGLGPDDYAPRSVYGEYLRFVFDSLVATAPAQVTVHPVRASVDRVDRRIGGKTVVADGREFAVHKVVLTTGHPRILPNDDETRCIEFAANRPALRFLRGDSAADLPLNDIEPGEAVGVVGLGLTFFDVVAALTIGRGGRFEPEADGALRYVPSGNEPAIFAGSRSGLVMLARGRNQKSPAYRYQPLFVTEMAIAGARRRAQRRDGSAQLDFVRDVLPLLQLEVEHTYYSALVRHRQGPPEAERFAARHLASDAGDRDKLLAEFGLADAAPIDLEGLARPFHDEEFASPSAFHDRLLDLLRTDIEDAVQGNVDGALKAALDILRDTRGSVRQAVEFGGLRPDSQRDDFLAWFNPINTMVSAGPPAIRVAQACALIRSGTITVVGPNTTVGRDEDAGTFVLSSPQVHGSRRAVTTLVDARIPRPRLHHDADPLIRRLLADGAISEHVNTDPITGTSLLGGCVAITRAPFRVIDAQGRPDPHLYALGVPTENTRWFTQIGNGRPGPVSSFHSDASAIASDVFRALRGVRQPPQPARREARQTASVVG